MDFHFNHHIFWGENKYHISYFSVVMLLLYDLECNTLLTLFLVCLMLQLGSLLSIHGCYQYHKKATGDKVDNVEADAEQGIYDSSALPQSSNNLSDQEKNLRASEVVIRQHAGIWGYIFQIIFQVYFSNEFKFHIE